MNDMIVEPRVIDAYRNPQQVRPGCQHQLGCRCDPPYWLRASSPAEEAREKWLRDGFTPQREGNG